MLKKNIDVVSNTSELETTCIKIVCRSQEPKLNRAQNLEKK